MNDKIGNRSLMQSLASVLGLEGVRRGPSTLKQDDLIPVIALDPAMAGYSTWSCRNDSLEIDEPGSGTFAWRVVGDQAQGFALAIPTEDTHQNTAGEENVILGMYLEIAYDAAGALADNGKEIEIYFRRHSDFVSSNVMRESNWLPAFTVVTSRLRYVWSFPQWSAKQAITSAPTYQQAGASANPIWVPAGTGIDLVVDRMDGSDFPANTVALLASFGVSCPKGFRPPGY